MLSGLWPLTDGFFVGQRCFIWRFGPLEGRIGRTCQRNLSEELRRIFSGMHFSNNKEGKYSGCLLG
jgi:hypothetical protein